MIQLLTFFPCSQHWAKFTEILDVPSFRGIYQQKVQRFLSFKLLTAHLIKVSTQKSFQTGWFHLSQPCFCDSWMLCGKSVFWIQRLRKMYFSLTEMWNRPFFSLMVEVPVVVMVVVESLLFWITSVSTCTIAVSKYQQALFLICISLLMFYGLPLDLESGVQLASKPVSFLSSE